MICSQTPERLWLQLQLLFISRLQFTSLQPPRFEARCGFEEYDDDAGGTRRKPLPPAAAAAA